MLRPSKSSGLVIPASTNETCRVPERWKIWAMLTMFAPASRVGEGLGHPGQGEVDVAVGQVLLGHDVDAGLDDLDVEAVALEDPSVTGSDVPGELRLNRPLEAQRDLVDRLALAARRSIRSARFGGVGAGTRCRGQASSE